MPKRVLQIVTNMGRGGIETMLMNYYRELDRSLLQFDFLVHRDYKSEYDDEILSLGGKIYHVPRLNPFSPRYYRALRDFFVTHDYDIVHSHLDCMSAFPLAAARSTGVPMRIAHAHSTRQMKNFKYPIKLISKHFIPSSATHLLACSQEAGKWMFSGCDFNVLPNSINAEAFIYSDEKRRKIRSELALGDVPVVGHVARFRSEKNQRFSVDVFAELLKIMPEAHLVFVGDGDVGCETEVRRLVDGMKLSSRVHFLGSRSDVSDILSAIDVFILPSLFEGLPLSVVEAQAAGLPCVLSECVSRECGFCENVEFISLERSPEHWARRIAEHICDARYDCRESICERGFDVKANAEKLCDFYLSGGETGWLA